METHSVIPENIHTTPTEEIGSEPALPLSDVLIHLLLSQTIFSPLPLRTAETPPWGECGSFLKRPIRLQHMFQI